MWMWSTGINRNIVECKVLMYSLEVCATVVLIETLWNVKTHIFHFSFLLEFRINRNIVECKDKYVDHCEDLFSY